MIMDVLDTSILIPEGNEASKQEEKVRKKVSNCITFHCMIHFVTASLPFIFVRIFQLVLFLNTYLFPYKGLCLLEDFHENLQGFLVAILRPPFITYGTYVGKFHHQISVLLFLHKLSLL